MANNTIKDIAKLAGVSIATVSRVVNQNYPVSELAREKVLKAITELNYRPNAIARSLKMEDTHTIGLLVSDIANPFFMNIAKALESVVRKFKYNIIVCSTEENEERETEYIRLLSEKRVDAIILSSSSKSENIAEKLELLDVPAVLIDRRLEGLDIATITDDNIMGAYILVKHLIDLGHTDIAIIDGPNSVSTGNERLTGYLNAYKDSDITVKKGLIFSGNYTLEYGYEMASKLFKQGMPVTAIFAANNLIAKGVLLAANDMQKNIPEDFSLVCFGEYEFTRLFNPPITCIVQKPAEIGAAAGEIILKKIADKGYKPESVVIPPEFFKGKSCKELVRKNKR